MKTHRRHFYPGALLLATLLAISTSASTVAATDDNTKSLEQAKSALEEAKSALEEAQSTLSEAQEDAKEKTQTTPVKSTAAKSEGDGRLYKWVDENGTVSYQDSPPPKNVKVLDSDVLKKRNTSSEPVTELRRASDPEPILDGSVPVMVYTADNCKPCQSVVLFLTQKQVPFIERDLRNDRRARERLSNLSKQISVPSLFIGERIVQGHSKPMITRALEEAGYLTPQ